MCVGMSKKVETKDKGILMDGVMKRGGGLCLFCCLLSAFGEDPTHSSSHLCKEKDQHHRDAHILITNLPPFPPTQEDGQPRSACASNKQEEAKQEE